MDRLRVGISRCSLALSLAVKLGLAAWLAVALLGGPTGSIALTSPNMPDLRPEAAVELAQSRRSKRRVRAARLRRDRERMEAQTSAQSQNTGEQSKQQNAGSASDKDAKADAGPSGVSKTSPGGDNAAASKAASPDHRPAEAQPETKEQEWSEAEIITALETCVELLAPIAAHVEVSKPIRSGQCGTPAAVVVRRVGATSPVEISPPAVVNCRMVAKLHDWVETILQPAAVDLLKAPVVRMINASGYVCRNRNGSSEDKISEHAFANALDISAFVTADRRTIDVLTHWGKTERDLRAIVLAKAEAEKQAKAEAAAAKAAEKSKGKAPAKDGRTPPPDSAGRSADAQPSKEQIKKDQGKKGRDVAASDRSNLGGGNPRSIADAREGGDLPEKRTEAVFLRRLHKGACGPFTTVLGPEANEAHRSHFHFDLAERRRRAFCE